MPRRVDRVDAVAAVSPIGLALPVVGEGRGFRERDACEKQTQNGQPAGARSPTPSRVSTPPQSVHSTGVNGRQGDVVSRCSCARTRFLVATTPGLPEPPPYVCPAASTSSGLYSWSSRGEKGGRRPFPSGQHRVGPVEGISDRLSVLGRRGNPSFHRDRTLHGVEQELGRRAGRGS